MSMLSVQTGNIKFVMTLKDENGKNIKMAESVHSLFTAVSWGFVSFTENSFLGRPEVGHFWCAWHACACFFFLPVVSDE